MPGESAQSKPKSAVACDEHAYTVMPSADDVAVTHKSEAAGHDAADEDEPSALETRHCWT